MNIKLMDKCKNGNHDGCPGMSSDGTVCNCSCHNKKSSDKFLNSADEYFQEATSKFKGKPTFLSENKTEETGNE